MPELVGEDVPAGDGLGAADFRAAVHRHEAAQMSQRWQMNAVHIPEHCVQRGCDLLQRGIARALAKAVDRDARRRRPRLDSGDGVRGSEAQIVVAVKFDGQVRHAAHGGHGLPDRDPVHDAQRVGEAVADSARLGGGFKHGLQGIAAGAGRSPRRRTRPPGPWRAHSRSHPSSRPRRRAAIRRTWRRSAGARRARIG